MKKTGILLINLGTPKAPTRLEVYKYLREFLMDPMVLDLPFVTRFVLVNLIIAPFRSKGATVKYKKIWDTTSPLLLYSDKLKTQMNQLGNHSVKLAMRYQDPSIKDSLESFKNEGIKNIVVLPMYPHRALSSSETAIKAFKKHAKTNFRYKVIKSFYDNQSYMDLISNHTRDYLSDCEHLLITFHSIPERHILKEFYECESCLDKIPCKSVNPQCYRSQCFFTAQKLATSLDMKDKYSVGFQSRLGKTPWIKPYTDTEIEKLSKKGIKKLAVVSPSFLVDCLETLEEINIGYRETFLKSGGEKFIYIPCLNESSELAKTMYKICQQTISP